MTNDMLGEMGRSQMVDPTKYPQIKCDKCGHNTFRKEVIMYNIPGVVIGAGNGDYPWPLPIYVCAKCGTIIKSVRDEIEKINETQKTENKSNLIL